MHRFKLVNAYEGTNYYGWQPQKDKPTIGQTLQDVHARTFDEHRSIIGVSRTDAGVHAREQIATVTMERVVSARRLQFAWNNALPNDIRIMECQEVPLTYSPFENMLYKTYHYHLLSPRTLPLHERYGWRIGRSINFDKLQRALQLFQGTHNFRSFCSSDDHREDTVRTINTIGLETLPLFHAHRIVIQGPAFLRHMIRRIVGAAVEIAWNPTRSLDELVEALENPSPRQRLFKAPAQGLILHNVTYSDSCRKDAHDYKEYLV
jgi:tRNA pseudouridine38-40 synthase